MPPHLASDVRGAAYIQKVAVISLFVLALFGAISALASTTAGKYVCIAATVLGTNGGANCGQPAEAPLPTDPSKAPPGENAPTQPPPGNLTLTTDIPLKNHTLDQACNLSAGQQTALNDAVAIDPALAAQYDRQNDTITFKSACVGSDTHSPSSTPSNEIDLDKGKFNNKYDLAIVAAHEMAHADYPPSNIFPATDTTKTCDQVADSNMLNEGNSAFAEFDLEYRVCTAQGQQGVDCQGLAQSQINLYRADAYNKALSIMDRYYSGQITKDQAVKELGDLYSATFVPSTGGGVSYHDYYKNSCECQRGNSQFCSAPPAGPGTPAPPCTCTP